MAIKLCLLLSLVVIMILSQKTSGFPRDSGVAVIEDLHGSESTPKLNEDDPKEPSIVPLQQGPHRVACINDSDEPSEDTTCQEHCLPKGYSYGLCVSETCTCV